MATAAATPTKCPHCAEPASGNFCSACGKALTEPGVATRFAGDVLGMKTPPVKAIVYTTWLAIAQPATLSRRWASGDRRGLMSPVAMISAVTAATAFVGFFLASRPEAQALAAAQTSNTPGMLWVGGFMKGWFPESYASAALRPEAFEAHFQRIGSLLVALWPLLFVLPGWLTLAPWKRVSSQGALIIASFEMVFLMIMAGLYMSLQKLTGGAIGGLIGTAMWLVVWAHGAVHIKQATESGWGYAAVRPPLAAIYFLGVIFLWVMIVLAIALASWRLG